MYRAIEIESTEDDCHPLVLQNKICLLYNQARNVGLHLINTNYSPIYRYKNGRDHVTKCWGL